MKWKFITSKPKDSVKHFTEFVVIQVHQVQQEIKISSKVKKNKQPIDHRNYKNNVDLKTNLIKGMLLEY